MSKEKGNGISSTIFVLRITSILFSILWPFLIVVLSGIPLTKKIDAEALNGILTISAIVFGFSGLGAYEKKALSKTRKSFIHRIFYAQIALFLFTGSVYFNDVITYDFPTVTSLTMALANLILNGLSWLELKMYTKWWGLE